MRSKEVGYFKARHPEISNKIRPEVQDGLEPFSIDIRPRDERSAIPGDISDCTIAHAAHRHLKCIDEAIFATVAYFLKRIGTSDHYQVVKYRHDGAAITRRLDQGDGNQSNQIVRFAPPNGDRAVGARHDRTHGRRPPSKESVKKGLETRKKNREAAISLRSFRTS